VPASERTAIEEAIEALRKIKDTGSKEELQAKLEALNQASHKLAEAMYRDTQAQQQAQGAAHAGADDAAGAHAGAGAGTDTKTTGDETVVDADFEEVK